MSDDTPIKRWTAKRKASVVMDIFKGKTTVAEVARQHDLGVCQHSWHIKWFWLFKTLLPAAPGPSRDSGALPLAG